MSLSQAVQQGICSLLQPRLPEENGAHLKRVTQGLQGAGCVAAQRLDRQGVQVEVRSCRSKPPVHTQQSALHLGPGNR